MPLGRDSFVGLRGLLAAESRLGEAFPGEALLSRLAPEKLLRRRYQEAFLGTYLYFPRYYSVLLLSLTA